MPLLDSVVSADDASLSPAGPGWRQATLVGVLPPTAWINLGRAALTSEAIVKHGAVQVPWSGERRIDSRATCRWQRYADCWRFPSAASPNSCRPSICRQSTLGDNHKPSAQRHIFVSCPRLVWMDWTHFTHSTYHFLNEKFLQSYFPQTYTISAPFCWQICDLWHPVTVSFHCLIFER